VSGTYSSYVCNNNSELVKEVSNLYLKDGDSIADITYGKGVFWKKMDLNRFDFYPSDIITCPEAPYDFKKLPYPKEKFDVVVFDPPYSHNPGQMIVNDNYQLRETTRGFYHKDIIQLYKEGMAEALRTLKQDGLLWVKCKDEIESSKQQMSHIEIFNIAINDLDFMVKDLFVMTQKNKPTIQFKNQQHARKNHSYLWVFKKN